MASLASLAVPELQPGAVAVVIPAYNAARTLADAIQSALAQTRAPAEILVVDDGSTDGTAEIARSFGGCVRVISRGNRGVSASRNEAVAATTCEWVALLDADDLWTPRRLERQMEEVMRWEFLRREQVDLVYTGLQLFREVAGERQMGVSRAAPTQQEFQRFLNEENPIGISVLLRRSRYLEVGGFDETLTHMEDWDLWLRLRSRGAVMIPCGEEPQLYRQGMGSLTTQPKGMMGCALRVFEQRVWPEMRPVERWRHRRRAKSRLWSEAAVLCREGGSREALPLMLQSVALHPTRDLRRYKIVLHMLLTRAGVLRRGSGR